MPRRLTGFTPSGNLHLGNYVGALRPIIIEQSNSDTVVFISDLHALTGTRSGRGAATNPRTGASVQYPLRTHLHRAAGGQSAGRRPDHGLDSAQREDEQVDLLRSGRAAIADEPARPLSRRNRPPDLGPRSDEPDMGQQADIAFVT
jgi:hypothetical protein